MWCGLGRIPMSGLQSRSNVPLTPEWGLHVCMCAFPCLALWYSHVACNPPVITCLREFKCVPVTTSPSQPVSLRSESPVCPQCCWLQTAGRLDVCIHINEAIKSFIHQLIYIAEQRGSKSKGFQNILQDLQIRWDKLFISLACCSFWR